MHDDVEQVRASGLVNKRQRLGWFEAPNHCSCCQRPSKRLEKHHEDYSRPHLVHFLCHSCHMKVHAGSASLAGIDPFDTGAGHGEWMRKHKAGLKIGGAA